jgi:hypothetical protein
MNCKKPISYHNKSGKCHSCMEKKYGKINNSDKDKDYQELGL